MNKSNAKKQQKKVRKNKNQRFRKKLPQKKLKNSNVMKRIYEKCIFRTALKNIGYEKKEMKNEIAY